MVRSEDHERALHYNARQSRTRGDDAASTSRWIVGLFAFAALMTPAILVAKGVAWIFGGNEAVFGWALIPLGIATVFVVLVLFPVIGALARSR